MSLSIIYRIIIFLYINIALLIANTSLASSSIEDENRTHLETLSILSINVFQFPWPIQSVFETPKKRRKRALALIQNIVEHKPLPDVILVQELWSKKAARKISKYLKNLYPYQFIDHPRHRRMSLL